MHDITQYQRNLYLNMCILKNLQKLIVHKLWHADKDIYQKR
jgi:hypothetical protein